MNPLTQDFRSLYKRDLDRLIDNLQSTSDEQLWKSPEGISNSCGVLAQHIVDNLEHYINHGIGQTDYVRQRDREFTDTHRSKEKLISDIEQLKETLSAVFNAIEDNQLTQDFPVDIPFEASNHKFLLHLYGHLNYHLGQLNYLHRMLAAG
ncbi:Protein of unknown function (DUF1572) [Fodinibius salinus]|uniref:DinB superfamily protein n=1 Tax=Fodinibius salinus TaxID=860790 RepID=A0A5D3YQI7_9BACT|nr:DinB family protein [Fodinibius salinus]TYP95329.1 Protein of unknown function (DUF1572) [Fodinibius salinus]